MPMGKMPIPVPKFTAYEMKLAELCAVALWQGINFETDKLAEVSDEVLLNNFHVAFQRLVKKPTLPTLINELQLRQLIRVGKLKAMFRSNLPLDFERGIDAIRDLVVPIYVASKLKNSKISRIDASTRATLDLALCWITNDKPSLNGNYRVPFSTRILFFACPEMKIFNYTNSFEKVLKLQVRPQAAITKFNELLAEGMILNSVLLNQCKLPTNSAMKLTTWKRVAKTDWWQRRVLDLALLLHYRLAVPNRTYTSKARALTRNSVSTP